MFKPFPLECLKNSEVELKNIINQNMKNLDELLLIEKKTYDNFMRPFMELDVKLNDFFTPISHLNSVNDTPETREIFSALLPIITDYSITMSQDERIYKAIHELQKTSMSETEAKVVEDNLLNFKLAGIGQNETVKELVKKNSMRLAELADIFSKNLLDSTNSFELILDDDSTFKAMPEIEKSVARIENNKYRFTLLQPSYIAFMTYCSDKPLREKVYKAYMTRAEINDKVIEEILRLRNEVATALQYKNFADMINVTMSAPNIETVIDTLKLFASKAKKQATAEFKQLSDFASAKGEKKVDSFDTAYYTNLVKKELLNFEEDKYMPYFEMTKVIGGVMEFVAKTFSLKFSEVKDTPIWHKDVKVYDLINISDGKAFARLYLDLITRKEKRGGAWMNNWHSYHKDASGNLHLPTAFIVANFLPSTKDNPSFLRHDDITTLFHEMGHTLHHLFSKVEEADASGVNGVEWDAIEFPSQLLELFAYDKNVLSSFAAHYQTCEKLGSEMIDRLIDNRNFGSAMQLLRQVEFALFDIEIHKSAFNYSSVRKILDDVRKSVAVLVPPSYTHFETTFSHIFAGGYAAGYYSYKWAEMLSDDVYLEFEKQSNDTVQFAKKYKENILEKGGSAKMLDLYINLMNRKPDPAALLKVNGIPS